MSLRRTLLLPFDDLLALVREFLNPDVSRSRLDRLCVELGIEHRPAPPMRPETNGRVERFNGRIEDVLQSHRFLSGEDLERTLLRYVRLYDGQLPQSVLKGRQAQTLARQRLDPTDYLVG